MLSSSFQRSLDYTRECREKENSSLHHDDGKPDDNDARSQKLSSNNDKDKKKGDDNDDNNNNDDDYEDNDDDDDDDDDDKDDDFCKRYITDLIEGKQTSTTPDRRGPPRTRTKKGRVTAIGSQSRWEKFLSFKDRQIRQEMEAINRAKKRSGGAVLTRSSSSKNMKQKQLVRDKEEIKEEDKEIEEEDYAMKSVGYKRKKNSDEVHNSLDTEPRRVAAELAQLKAEDKIVSTHTNADRILFLPNCIILMDDIQIGSASQGKELSGESKDKKKQLRILQTISQIFSYLSNHLSLNALIIAHDITLSSGSGGKSADYVRLIKSNINFWLLFPLSTREIRSLLISYSSGIEYGAIRNIINTALQPKHTSDDPYTSDRVSISPCLGFFFPNAASDKQVLNFIENPLNAIFQDNSPLLPIATLSHTVFDNQTTPSTQEHG